MAITVKHTKVSTIPDGDDTSVVRPSDWNADHQLVGTVPVANGGTGASTASDGLNALLPSQTSNNGKVLTTDGTNATWVAGGSGTVTSVAATAGTGISVSGSPITTSGTLTITNTAPDQTVSIASGTGISATGTYPAFTVTNTAPDQTVSLTGGTGISTSGTYPNFTITNTSPSLGGDVVGPASATDNAIARFDTTTGKLLQNSVVTVGDTGATTGITTLSASTSVTTPIVQATNSAGLALKNSAGSTQMTMGAGGFDNLAINVPTNINGANAQIDISPTGTGHVHIKPSGTGGVEIAPTNAGTMNNMVIGGTTPLAITGTTITATSFVGSGASLTNVVNSLAASTGISVSGSTGAVTVTNTAPDQTVVLTAGTGISTSGTYPNFTITNTAPSGSNTYTRTSFTATASQTTFTVTYTVGYVEVYVNGVLLNGDDYTASNGTSVVLAVGCNAGDIVETIAFSTFNVANTVSSFSAGTTGLTPSTGTTGNVTLGGTLAVANGGTGVTTSTGSGANVLGTSPTLTSPTITGAVVSSMASSVITSGTAVASTSGTSIDFTGIPNWVKRITVMFNGVSTNGISNIQIQIGSGSVTTTGYSSQASGSASFSGVITSGFVLTASQVATYVYSGKISLNLIGSNTWIEDGYLAFTSVSSYGWNSAGNSSALSGALDRVRITTINGTNTFDAGSINILYE
jgi:hypothetical protein